MSRSIRCRRSSASASVSSSRASDSRCAASPRARHGACAPGPARGPAPLQRIQRIRIQVEVVADAFQHREGFVELDRGRIEQGIDVASRGSCVISRCRLPRR
jgi:hypothetical protein